ncbi:MAG TPA: hypothetical protein VFV86_00565 [Nitrososphaeraceae archaeon]|nr:hypothetical protein [Nitrososphaeraceae archaeon]
MNLSNAMAITDYDNTDQYMKYTEEMTNDNYYKSHSDLIQKIKCNNINANLNGINANIGSAPVEDGDTDTNGANSEALAAQGDEPNTGYGDRNFVDRTSNFSFKCLNNNNNVVVQEEGEEPGLACEECFAANSTLRAEIIDALVDFEGSIVFSSEDFIFAITSGTDTIEELCAILESSSEFYGAPIPSDVFDTGLSFILSGGESINVPALDELIECLLEAGILVDIDFGADLVSATGLDSMNIQCEGSPLCAKIEQ